jgi:two-component system, NtrC family, response regulator HydG
MSQVLVVDDKELMRDSVAETLKRAGFEVQTADGAESALGLIARRRPDVVISDLKMPGMTGIELVTRVKAIDDELPVIIMTAFATVETAVQAIKQGAFHYVTKPFEGDELVIAVKRAISHQKTMKENGLLRVAQTASGPVEQSAGIARLIGESPAMRRVREQVLAMAESQGTVLVYGESGSGKEVVAKAVHEQSPRSGKPFLAVNCAALSESLLESELFGHEKGAFTGADKLRKGRFELADGGTLLLDEISEIPPTIQAKLLRVLQERAFERVGSSVTIGVDVRVVATSNRDLPQAVARGDFRQDLFFRLNVLPIHLPPLRDRLEDVPALASHFVAQVCRREGREPLEIEPGALSLMREYPWPGNVRELQNICERAVVLCGSKRSERGVIHRELIEPWLTIAKVTPSTAIGMNGHSTIEAKPMAGLPTDRRAIRPLEEIERDMIVHSLQLFEGHRQKTAKALGIGVRTLGLKLKKWKQLKLIPDTI